MNKIDFATEYAGKTFGCPYNYGPLYNPAKEEVLATCIVIGYHVLWNSVVVSFTDDSVLQKRSWPIYTSSNIATTTDITDIKTYWTVPHNVLVPLKKETRASNINIYNSFCKLCSAPARKTKHLVVCSQAKCKSRKQLLKKLNIKALENQNTMYYPIICPYCNTCMIPNSVRDGASSFYVHCVNHKKNIIIKKTQLKINNIMAYGRSSSMLYWVWNGKTWHAQKIDSAQISTDYDYDLQNKLLQGSNNVP